eukprot:1348517-Amorphochlora_amoeboformis.AAC.2
MLYPYSGPCFARKATRSDEVPVLGKIHPDPTRRLFHWGGTASAAGMVGNPVSVLCARASLGGLDKHLAGGKGFMSSGSLGSSAHIVRLRSQGGCILCVRPVRDGKWRGPSEAVHLSDHEAGDCQIEKRAVLEGTYKTFEVMTDPAHTSELITYEYKAIAEYLNQAQECMPKSKIADPVTGRPLQNLYLIPNLKLKGQIRMWREKKCNQPTSSRRAPAVPRPPTDISTSSIHREPTRYSKHREEDT